ncbi:MAG: glycoside hydrolase family 2, partial [Lachnospiraceae bacterium]|nr:glycoside hydrolase family 2 [Lachnospiraceae bacterium]
MSTERWQSYPRPQRKRKGYKILNGTWKLAGQDIQVPFVPQSRLSEYKGEISEEMVYTMEFEIPEDFNQPYILLHFGAIDEEALVIVNNRLIGGHHGGYLPFS